MEAGTIADWVAAIATLMATGAAVIAGGIAYRAYERETLHDRQRAAAGVHAWVASDNDVQKRSEAAVLMVLNTGEELIYDVHLEVQIDGTSIPAPGRGDKSWKFLPPGTFFVGPGGANPSGGRYPWGFPEATDDNGRFRPWVGTEKFLVTRLDFTDSRGMRWSRDASGRLHEVT